MFTKFHGKKMPLRNSFVVFILMLLFSCQEDAVAPVKEPNPLMGYLESFLEEAEKRGVEIDTSGLVLVLVDVVYPGASLCGLGNKRLPGLPPEVRICKICACWVNGTSYYRNELLFHEFGHALLGRLHDNGKLPNGSKKSIMNESASGSSFWQGEERLKYYIDELFDPSTPVPDWAK